MNKLTPLELRQKARADLRLLFNRPDPTEEEIMYMLGLYTSGADIVSLALQQLPPEEYDKAWAKSPGDDVDESDLIAHGYHEPKDKK